MLCPIIRFVLRRASRPARISRGERVVPAPFLYTHQRYFSGHLLSRRLAPDQSMANESLKKMDLDRVEKAIKQALGNSDAWDHNKLKSLLHVICILPISDVMRFADYAVGGYCPDGGKASFPLLTEEEMFLIDKPYHEWATEPFDKLQYSCHENIKALYMNTGDDVHLKTPPFAAFPARLVPLYSKIWLGRAPISHDRWLEKKMDDPANYRNLFELMEDILLIFSWLNDYQTQLRLRSAFNHLFDSYVEFGSAANLRREQSGIKERLDMAGMCVEYFRSIATTASNRTHQWLVDRVNEVQSRAFDQYTASLERAGTDQEAIGAAGRKYYECVQDLNALLTKADYHLSIPMSDFKGVTSSDDALDLDLPIRAKIYAEIAESKSWRFQEAILKRQDQDPPQEKVFQDILTSMNPEKQPAPPRFRDYELFQGHYHEGKKNRAEIRKVLRGEPKTFAEEYWITILKERMEFYLSHGRDRKTHRWGFVCYRLTYNQTDEEWATFQKKFEADVFRSGKWIEGYDSIADMAGIEYVDGRDFAITEGDIEAAKKHFKSTYTVLPTLGRMWTLDFLVIDTPSYQSYARPPGEEKPLPLPFGPSFGDEGGFVRLVDTTNYDQQFLDESAPGYTGSFNVLSTLILEDLYPLITSQIIRPSSLWPIARLHPQGVYVGPTVIGQEAWFEWQRIDKVTMTSAFIKHLREKKAALGNAK
ncbi:hypothetical protein DM02DRAFT_615896 [Periconia macrospinosa]|uniref:Uncharacterized protein n=1 Tax=Periconia macrospinosa TaxID=97972 RepID=A0A2V1DJH1_9PLEO|nr:hypothetical protein DM02DRAFT_615896 [Periconia macrospinosa]